MRKPGEGPHPIIGNPLFGRYDQDPGRYRPQFYHVEVSVPVGLNGVGRGSINIQNEPFAMTRITHKIVGDVDVPSTSGLYQNAMYDVEWKDEQRTYTDGPIPADLMFGWNTTGYVLEMPFPIGFPGNKTLSFIVTNRILRVLDPVADYFNVSIVLHGVCDMGPPQGR